MERKGLLATILLVILISIFVGIGIEIGESIWNENFIKESQYER